MRRLLAVSLILWPLAGQAVPPEDGVCGDLKGATPGLFGLCVAYCEAQDLGDAEKAGSKRSALSLLTAYERKRGPGDPDMPCLVDAGPPVEPPPLASCSCWSAEDLDTALPAPACQVSGTTYAAGQESSSSTSVAVVVAEAMQFARFCQFADGVSNQPLPPKLVFGLEDEDMKGCVALWQYHAKRKGCLVE